MTRAFYNPKGLELETQFKVGEWVRIKGKPYQIAQIDNVRYEAECECEEDIDQIEYILHNGMITTKEPQRWAATDGELVCVEQRDEHGVYAVIRPYDSLRANYFKGCEPFVNEKPSFIAGSIGPITALESKSIFDLLPAVDSTDQASVLKP